ncbi:MAG: tRNA pseudouridine(38-40) synthase TruA [Culturomica sp.]|jgi:tRNA pseudouridine38-40 synthase|nr:tRNA pseudouridine(38-40) synthase TruA [Culturomica sp.]
MQRYFIELSYNGSAYNGWQIQPDAPSVQEELNSALSRYLRQETAVVGAGRTDTGVHASFFIAHFDTEAELPDPELLVHKLNSMTGKGIAVHRIYPVAPETHARFSACSRTYKYFIDKEKDPFTCDFAARFFPLPDIDKMNEACAVLFEYIDFTSFAKLHTDTKTNLCTILEAGWKDTGKQLVFTIRADRFLRNMVRAIVGTLAEVGQGKLSAGDFRAIIEAKDRCRAGMSAPGKGLFLCGIEYPDNLLNRRT